MHFKAAILCSASLLCGSLFAAEKPNVILYFADDISAREFPIYGSTVWTDPHKKDTQDPKYRAKMPVVDRLAEEGVWVKNVWAATVCGPSRAMMMTGRYAHLHKWWHNKDKGEYIDPEGQRLVWPLYESSPLLIGHVAQKAGYASYWAGKTQMPGDLTAYGFDEGCFTPGNLSDTDNPYTDFKLEYRKVDGKKMTISCDTGKEAKTYLQHGWYWFPHVRLMNDPRASEPLSWWPNSPESEKRFGLNTFGPDVEQEFVFDFMERQHQAGKPFFIYHTTHLGHAAWDWFHPVENGQSWVPTPMVKWDGKKYTRVEPNITGDNGKYDTHGTITDAGIHNHLSYIDYQVWRYLEKLKAMGIDKNTIIIVAADNGTGGYGKDSPDRQKGCHVPFIVYAPGETFAKHGGQDILLNLCDVLPTLADIMGYKIPDGYQYNGVSFWPWLTTDQPDHRDWIYAYRKEMQLVRGKHIMKDGWNKWYDMTGTPNDLISFKPINDWGAVPELYREERERLLKTIEPFNLHDTAHDAPGVPPKATKPPKKASPSAPPANKAAAKGVGGHTREDFCAWKMTEMEKKGKPYDQAKVEKLFYMMDVDKNGLVTREEQKAYYTKKQ